MSSLFWLTAAQMAWLEPFFPECHGKPRVDGPRVLSGIIVINRNGLRWRDAAEGRPTRFFMTAGQVSDDAGAAALPGRLPEAEWLLADRGYDADWFRDALKDNGIKNNGIRPCIPGRKSRGKPINYDKRRYKRRNRIEIMFGRLKDWRRVAARYDRSPQVFLSAVALTATVIFWL